MLNVKLLNKSGKLIKLFHNLKDAYSYAQQGNIDEFSIQATLT